MHSSPVAFRKPLVDEHCVQLIGGNILHEPCTPEEPPSSETRPKVGNGNPITFYLYHKVFIKTLQKPIFWLLSHLPLFIVMISILELTMCMQASKKLRQILNFDPCHRNQIYRFLTYMLVHANATHMAMNVLIQLFIGTPMETEQGHLRAAVIYIGGGLGGSLGSSVAEPNTVVEGASAGVYAILMAQISHIILNYPDLRYKKMRGLAVGLLLTADIAQATYHVYSRGNTAPKISLPAHICGALAGVLLGLFIFKGTSKWTTVIKIVSGTILGVLYLSAIIYNTLRITT